MKKGVLSLLVAGIFSFSSLYTYNSRAEDAEPSARGVGSKLEDRLDKETPTEVVADAFEKGILETRDLFSIIGRIDEEKIEDRSKYSDMKIDNIFYTAVVDEMEKNPLFYDWEYYEQGEDLIIENQLLSAGWNIGVAKFPNTLGLAERAGVYAKRKTTLEVKSKKSRLKINPELDNDGVNLRMKLKKEDSWMNDLKFKVGLEKVKLGKSIKIKKFEKANFSIDSFYDWKEDEYCLKLTLKLPILPYKNIRKESKM